MDDPEPHSLFMSQMQEIAFLGIDFWIPLAILFVLLFCSALISGSEVAFFSLTPGDRGELKELKSKSAIHAFELLNTPKELLAVILIINNFVNIAIVILSSYLFLMIYPKPTDGNDLLHAFIEVVGITFIILLLGEIIPKVYANRNSLKLVILMATPIKVVSKIPPFSWIKLLLISGTDVILRSSKKRSMNVSTEDLETAIALTREEDISTDEHKLLEGIVKFGNTDVKQIMCSRVDTVAVDFNASFSELMEVIVDAGYSRIPVYKETFDEVVGIMYVKDLLPHLDEGHDFKWNSLIRTPFFVPENKKIDDLLKEFQELKMHMAVVVDEYGGASGVVTMEDVLEEIVGEITDEFDDEDIVYTKIDDRTFVIEGKTSLVDMYKILNIEGKSFEQMKGEADSIAGFLIEQSGEILQNNQQYEFDGINFIVEASDKKRIKRIKVVINRELDSAE